MTTTIANASKGTRSKPKDDPEELINFRLPKSLCRKIRVHAAQIEKEHKAIALEAFTQYFADKDVPGA